jgi:CHAT domain-containing protein
MTAGDLALGDPGAPEELGLSARVSSEVLSRRAGVAALTPHASDVAARIAEARSWYARAAALPAEACPRCATDLQTRAAYLKWLSGDPQGSLAGFAAAQARFVELGDKASAARLVFPQLGILLQTGGLLEARRLFDSSRPTFVAAGRLGWGARISELLLFLAQQQRFAGNFGVALEAIQLSARVAEDLQVLSLLRPVRDLRATLLGSLGLHREAIVDLRALFQNPPPGDQMDPAAWRQAIAARLFGEYTMTKDFGGAHKMLGIMCGACQDGSLLVTEHRFDDAFALAQTNGDQVLKATVLAATSRFSEAAPLIQGEMQALLRRLEAPAPDAAHDLPFMRTLGLDCQRDGAARWLCQQQLRERASQLAILAARANLFRPAADFVQSADRHFARSILANDEEPWEEPAERALLAEGLGDPAKARTEYGRAVAIVEKTVPELIGRDVEQDLREKAGYLYRDYAAFLARQAIAGQGAVEDGLAALEDWRAQRFLTKLLRADAARRDGERDLLLIRQQASLESRIAAMRRTLMHTDVSVATRGGLGPELARLEGDLARFAASHPSVRPTGMSQSDFKKVLEDVRERASSRAAQTVFVCYFLTRDSSFAWVVDDHEVTLRALPVAREEIDRLTATLLNAIRDDDAAWERPATALYAKLVAPIEDLLPGGPLPARLGLVPFGSMARIPFHALLRDGEPLASRHPIFYLSSLRSFVPLQNLARRRAPAAQGRNQVVAFGFNSLRLLAAEDEARHIGGPRNSIVGAGATKHALLAAASRADILHVSAHAEQDLSNPFASFIELADGPLQMGDFAGARFGSRLLVLSACDTGRAEHADDEEQTGLAWAALAAGIPTVMVSGWAVDDARTGALMADFYTKAGADGDLVGAWARTQGAWAARLPPRIWAAFSLLGADQ